MLARAKSSMGFFLFARIISLGVETIVIYGKLARPFARRGESSVGDGGDGRGKGRLADGYRWSAFGLDKLDMGFRRLGMTKDVVTIEIPFLGDAIANGQFLLQRHATAPNKIA